MAINNRQRKQLRNIGHKLKPVVMISGNGLTHSVLGEIERALNDHELIKIKLAVVDRQQRKAIIHRICQHTHAEIIQTIGKIALIYLASLQPNTKLSNVRARKTGML